MIMAVGDEVFVVVKALTTGVFKARVIEVRNFGAGRVLIDPSPTSAVWFKPNVDVFSSWRDAEDRCHRLRAQALTRARTAVRKLQALTFTEPRP